METSDDAAVYQISDEIAMIQTVDFFTPVVDDPYLFGQIAAANALSDVYAMGGEPSLALNIVGFPNCLDTEILGEILAGGADKVKEAGAVLAGGHSVQDDEPKYGLCVTGFVHPDKMLKNTGAKPGDVLLLTKQIGSGIINTAVKAGMASEASIAETAEVMSTLNKIAKDAMEQYEIHSCTDVTGFGLMGHALEMAKGSGVSLEIDVKQVPFMEEAAEYARMGLVPGGSYKNRSYVEQAVSFGAYTEEWLDLVCDPQTSGGLLMSLSEKDAQSVLQELKERGLNTKAAVIGKVTPQQEKNILLK